MRFSYSIHPGKCFVRLIEDIGKFHCHLLIICSDPWKNSLLLFCFHSDDLLLSEDNAVDNQWNGMDGSSYDECKCNIPLCRVHYNTSFHCFHYLQFSSTMSQVFCIEAIYKGKCRNYKDIIPRLSPTKCIMATISFIFYSLL